MEILKEKIENLTLEVYGSVEYTNAYIKGFQECQKRVLNFLKETGPQNIEIR